MEIEEGKGFYKGIKVCHVLVSTSPKECKCYVLQNILKKENDQEMDEEEREGREED